MFMHIGFWNTVFAMVAVSAAVSGAAPTAQADVVRGKVTFERRYTIVPMVCTRNGCRKSEPYWSLVISGEPTIRDSSPGTYEVDRVFALGSEHEPDKLEVAGVMLSPGARVQVKGSVEKVSDQYSILSNVSEVKLLMDSDEPVSEATAPPFRPGWPTFGYICHSEDHEGTMIFADVLYLGESSRSAVYRIQVLASGAANVHEPKVLARVESGSVRTFGEELIFDGETHEAAIHLSIHSGSELYRDLPGTLDYSRNASTLEAQFPLEAAVDVKCSARK